MEPPQCGEREAGPALPGIALAPSKAEMEKRASSGAQPARLRLSSCFWDLAGPTRPVCLQARDRGNKPSPRIRCVLPSTSVPALQEKLSSQPHLPRGQMDAKLQFPAYTTAGAQAPFGVQLDRWMIKSILSYSIAVWFGSRKVVQRM